VPPSDGFDFLILAKALSGNFGDLRLQFLLESEELLLPLRKLSKLTS
jgi:hypothetical protein